jgi:primosomal protein N' (replication factor Y) (superfamily II helicase)
MTNGGGETGLLPGMGDLPERATGTPPEATKGGPAKAPAKPGKGARQPAARLPVARVAVDIPLPHLDRPFDYLVPESLDDAAVPGCRVRIRFAGQLIDGFLLARVEESGHGGRLSFLERVTSPEPVLAAEIAALAREVADRYAGTLADVLRLAVPPRHARVEAEKTEAEKTAAERTEAERTVAERTEAERTVAEGTAAERTVAEKAVAPARPVDPPPPDPPPDPPSDPGPWADYPAGPSFLSALAAGHAPRAVWTAMPGPDWPRALARAVRATLAGGRGALVVVADGRDVVRVDAALTEELAAESAGEPRHVALTAELGPAERYRRWLKVRRGAVRAVVGTRAAMFAPVADLGLVVLWDDGDDVYAEPHAPYPHAREVLALRAHRTRAGALIGGFTRTTDATWLVETGWARPLVPGRQELRRAMPRIRAAGDDHELARDEMARTARLPDLALRSARSALEHGPVLVQVPRRGYLPALACARCRAPARCTACSGPLAMRSSHAVPYCRWCGRIAGDRRCADCGDLRVRAVVVGAGRTAEELGRAFPGVSVRTSGRDGVLAGVGPEQALVVATPGAEPVAGEGYAAALLLDGWALLGRPDLRADEEALRRWMNAAALVRAGGPVIVLAEGALPPVQALIRWDPVTMAERQLAERRELGFPPAARMASLTGTPAALRELLAVVRLPEGAEVLGPVPAADRDAEPQERALVRVARPAGSALAAALKAAQGVRSARKTGEMVRVQLDPLEVI